MQEVNEILNQITKQLTDIENKMYRNEILLRVNNLLLARFILQLYNVRSELGLPKRHTAFKFEILEDDYEDLCKEFGKDDVDKALYWLDRALLLNKQDCPNNIKRYIVNKLKKKQNKKNTEEYKDNSE